MWLYRRPKEPAPTEVASYRKKSLGKVGTNLTFIKKEMSAKVLEPFAQQLFSFLITFFGDTPEKISSFIL